MHRRPALPVELQLPWQSSNVNTFCKWEETWLRARQICWIVECYCICLSSWQLSWISLLGKGCSCCLSSKCCGGWSGLSMMESSLFSDLVNTTASKVSSLQPVTESAFLISLVSMSLSPALMLLLQQTTVKQPALSTAHWSPIFSCTHWKISASLGNRAHPLFIVNLCVQLSFFY